MLAHSTLGRFLGNQASRDRVVEAQSYSAVVARDSSHAIDSGTYDDVSQLDHATPAHSRRSRRSATGQCSDSPPYAAHGRVSETSRTRTPTSMATGPIGTVPECAVEVGLITAIQPSADRERRGSVVSTHRWWCAETTTMESKKRLLIDNGGQIQCDAHAPFKGSGTWHTGQWRPMRLNERVDFEADIGRPPHCETCAAIERRAREIAS